VARDRRRRRRPPVGVRVSEAVAIVGVGRIGAVLARALPDAARVGRGTAVPLAATTWVCVGEPDLPTAWAAVPAAGRSGVILVQNGLLAPWVAREAPGCTTGVLYFAAPARDGVASGSGTSAFFGPRAQVAVDALSRVGLPAAISGSDAEHARTAARKLAWTCVLGVLCARGGGTVGEALERDRALLGALVEELAPVLAHAHGVPIDAADVLRSVEAYSLQVAEWRAGVKALPWRNGALLAAAARAGLPDTLHRAVLAELGVDVAAVSRAAAALLYCSA
jgi:hypothetical protein